MQVQVIEPAILGRGDCEIVAVSGICHTRRDVRVRATCSSSRICGGFCPVRTLSSTDGRCGAAAYCCLPLGSRCIEIAEIISDLPDLVSSRIGLGCGLG